MTIKSLRDSALTNSSGLAIYLVLTSRGFGEVESVICASLGAFMVALGYRIVRRRWPWLLAADPPGGAK